MNANETVTPISFDRDLIRYQCSIMHGCAKATGRDGVLQLIMIDVEADTTNVLPFEIGDIDGMVSAAMSYESTPHANVYTVWALMRRGIAPGLRGGADDVV